MKKYDQLVNKLTEETDNQLEMGISVEKEHKNIYDYFNDFCKEHDIKMPITEEIFYSMVAKAHLDEIKNYYTLLKQMETSAKNP